MPTQTTWIDPEIFLEHNGKVIFHAYKDDDWDQGRMTFWFTTEGDDDSGAYHFDARELIPQLPEVQPLWSARPEYIGHEAAERRGLTWEQWQASDERKRLEVEWCRWHDEGEPAAIKATISAAIDAGLVKFPDDTQEG